MTRKAWYKSADAPKRLSGRKLQERRKRWFARFPLCVHCEQEDRVTLATALDHVVPLFQNGADDESNIQGLCEKHHDAKSLKEKGYRPKIVIGIDGYPLEK